MIDAIIFASIVGAGCDDRPPAAPPSKQAHRRAIKRQATHIAKPKKKPAKGRSRLVLEPVSAACRLPAGPAAPPMLAAEEPSELQRAIGGKTTQQSIAYSSQQTTLIYNEGDRLYQSNFWFSPLPVSAIAPVVVFTPSIPEPSTWISFLIGLAVIVGKKGLRFS